MGDLLKFKARLKQLPEPDHFPHMDSEEYFSRHVAAYRNPSTLLPFLKVLGTILLAATVPLIVAYFMGGL